jgi:hypothetical protein
VIEGDYFKDPCVNGMIILGFRETGLEIVDCSHLLYYRD